MKKKMRKALMVILFAVFAVSTLMALLQWMDNSEGEAAYADAAQIAMHAPEKELPRETQPEMAEPAVPADVPAEPVTYWAPVPVKDSTEMEEMKQISITALQEKNEDVVGWVRIPGTKVDYPIMQGQDNDFYLNHTWDKQANSVGSIFMEHLNNPEMTDFNTIVYGHNMRNNSMFGDLENYSQERFFQDHPYVYVTTEKGVYRYEVFAFFLAEVDSLTYGLNLTREDTKREFLDLALENARYDTGIEPEVTDLILTLSTCSGGSYASRYVVQARLPMMKVTK